MPDTVLADIAGGIALLTLNRPHKLNALNYETIDRSMVLLIGTETASRVHTITLTGTARAFQVYEIAGVFSGIAMSLNALVTSFLVPLAVTLLVR